MGEGERERGINMLCWVMIKGQYRGDWFDAQGGLTLLHYKPLAKPRLIPVGAGSNSCVLDSQCKGDLNP